MSRFIRSARCLTVLALALACVLALCACSAPQAATDQDDSVAANRQYMSSLNQMSEDLSGKLQDFADAASRNDLVSMRTQAGNAFQIIADMRDQDAPEDLSSLKDGYMEACDSLQTALSSFIDLYADAAASPMDRATYDARLQEVQGAYDAAIQKLEETDQAATELQK